jgi:LCP family protein required for cell wall assembly
VDTQEELQIQDYAGSSGQADCLILISLNTEDKTATMLNISRDSMIDVDIYSMTGDYLTSQRGQIALQYAYGDGEKKSCWLIKKAVSTLLHDIPIHSYLAMNVDGISTIADVLGGVKITVPKDYTSIDPSFVEGATITLKGEQAERYVRHRDINEFGSNNGRMERQNQFLRALIGVLKTKVSENSSYVETLLNAGKSFMTTDMSVDQMKELATYTMSEDFLKVPGETQAGEEHDEYIVNDDELMEMLIKMFYIQK